VSTSPRLISGKRSSLATLAVTVILTGTAVFAVVSAACDKEILANIPTIVSKE
jgi:hypothetical protein